MKVLLVCIAALAVLLASCEKTELKVEDKVLYGRYDVIYKDIIDADGTETHCVPIGRDGDIADAWMAPTILIFTEDSLGISQLMNEGWSTGYVELERINDIPSRVGCHPVTKANDYEITWRQGDQTIRYVLLKMR